MIQETLYITQNTPYLQNIIVKDSQGLAIDLTDYTGSLFISKYFGSERKYKASLQFDPEVTGKLSVAMRSETTAILPSGLMTYSMFLTPPGVDTDKFLFLQGQVVIIPTIFHADEPVEENIE